MAQLQKRRQKPSKAASHAIFLKFSTFSKHVTKQVQVGTSKSHARRHEQNSVSKPYTALLDLNGSLNIYRNEPEYIRKSGSNYSGIVSPTVKEREMEEKTEMRDGKNEHIDLEVDHDQWYSNKNQATLYCGAQFAEG